VSKRLISFDILTDCNFSYIAVYSIGTWLHEVAFIHNMVVKTYFKPFITKKKDLYFNQKVQTNVGLHKTGSRVIPKQKVVIRGAGTQANCWYSRPVDPYII
jgi:hypothetical protein